MCGAVGTGYTFEVALTGGLMHMQARPEVNESRRHSSATHRVVLGAMALSRVNSVVNFCAFASQSPLGL